MFSNNKVSLNFSGIAVFVVNTHKMPNKRERAERYLSLIGTDVKLKEFLGEGTDGAVWATSRDSAVKVFDRKRGYENERDTYQRLAHFGITEKIGHFEGARKFGFDAVQYTTAHQLA